MTGFSGGIIEALPYLFAFFVGAMIPRRQGWAERVGIGVVGVLAVAFVMGLWPEAADAEATQAVTRADEWPQLLNVIVFLPIVGAVAILFAPRQNPKLLRAMTMGILAADFLISLGLLRANMTTGWHFQYVTEWLPTFGIRYHVAIDGISLWMVLLSTVTTPIAALVSFGSIKKRTKDLCFAMLLLHGGMLGAFVSLDLFLFYVFWELMLIPMVILIGVWGGVEKIKAAYKFLLFTMAGSVLMLAAILYMVWAHRQAAGFVTFDYLAMSNLVLPRTAATLCFIAFAFAFVVKVPMWPLHTWLPDAHVQAPTGGSIILAAVLLKLGTYGYVRFCMGMLGGPAYDRAATLAGVAVGGGILYGALCAWKQTDVKRLVAYSSVAHMGFVMLGLFAATTSGIKGALLTMINHGIATGALFLLVGVIYDRRHTRLVSEFGGLAKVMPVYAAVFVIVTMASIGVPGTNGFVGEFMVIVGTFVSSALGRHGSIQAVLATFGVILAAVYMLSVVQKMFFGPITNKRNENLPDMNVRETLAVAPLVALIFVLGLFPSLVLDTMDSSVAHVIDKYNSGRDSHRGNTIDELRLLNPSPKGDDPTSYDHNYPVPPKSDDDESANAASRPLSTAVALGQGVSRGVAR